jgi:hypothetical protein
MFKKIKIKTKMSHVQSSFEVFHEFVIQNLCQVSGILALFLIISYHLFSTTSIENVIEEDANEDDANEEDVNEEDVNKENVIEEEEDMTFKERLDHTEITLLKQLELMQKLNRIEKLSEQIEEEKEKGNMYDRLEVIEHKKLVYKFNIADFNNFCRSIYKEVESGSHIKKRSHIIKKVGKMWRNMEDNEKTIYSC